MSEIDLIQENLQRKVPDGILLALRCNVFSGHKTRKGKDK